MAKMVTRTFIVTEVGIKGFDLSENQVVETSIKIPGTIADEKAAMKVARKAMEHEGFKVLKAEVINVEETLYGMPEDEFIAHAKVLPPRKGGATTEEE